MAFTRHAPSQSKRRRSLRPIAEMNVTPMVDVMLVLLVIFMVSAPLMTTGVPVDLPTSQARPLKESTKTLSVSLNKQGEVFIQDTLIPLDSLVPRLRAIVGANAQARIHVRADHSLPYGTVMTVMGSLSQAGFQRVALVTTQVTTQVSTPVTTQRNTQGDSANPPPNAR